MFFQTLGWTVPLIHHCNGSKMLGFVYFHSSCVSTATCWRLLQLALVSFNEKDQAAVWILVFSPSIIPNNSLKAEMDFALGILDALKCRNICSLCLYVQAALCVGSQKVWTKAVFNYKVKIGVQVSLMCIYHKCRHLQNNSKNGNYTRGFCYYYGHHLVVICKLLHRSWFEFRGPEMDSLAV